MPPADFSLRLIDWQQSHGRHRLPWQTERTPYRVWLSEIMLQQTQVATVLPYFERFVARFPSLALLAQASEDEILALWSGLGYYSRARNLRRAARQVIERHAGVFPDSLAALVELPGIGRSTAAAIVSLAYGARAAILDGNVKRVLARHAGIAGWPGEKPVEQALWREAEARLPDARYDRYTQAMMDLGALICTRTRPACATCPVADDCIARREGRTTELPGARPRTPKRIETTQMLLLVDSHGRLLLEKRPPNGIWGGLWSLPQLAPEADPLDFCLARLGQAPASQETLPAFRHVFTHFSLDITPRLIHLDQAGLPAASPPLADQLWLERDAALGCGLPAPVRKLVQGFLP